jgi:hypothetical protein
MGERSNHIELPTLYDLIRGVASMDAESQSHIRQCEQCRSDVSWLQWLADFGAREKEYDPPSWALANAENVFKLKKPRLVTIAKEIVASLIYDSFSEPLPMGVRQRDLPARQALFKADKVHLDLKIEVGDEKGLIIGQVVADHGEMHIDGLTIEITQEGQVVSKSSTNALGEFVFQDLPRGNYELQVVLDDTMVRLPSLPLDEA